MLIFGNAYVHLTVALQTHDWCGRLLYAVNLMLANLIIDQHLNDNRHHSYVRTFNWLSVELKPEKFYTVSSDSRTLLTSLFPVCSLPAAGDEVDIACIVQLYRACVEALYTDIVYLYLRVTYFQWFICTESVIKTELCDCYSNVQQLCNTGHNSTSPQLGDLIA